MRSTSLRQALTILLLVAVVLVVLYAILYRPRISQIWQPALCTPLPSGFVCEGDLTH